MWIFLDLLQILKMNELTFFFTSKVAKVTEWNNIYAGRGKQSDTLNGFIHSLLFAFSLLQEKLTFCKKWKWK